MKNANPNPAHPLRHTAGFPSAMAVFLLLLLTCFQPVHAQTSDIWYFGNLAGLDFSGGPPVVINNSTQALASEGCSSICDNAGNLLLYTNGQELRNAAHGLITSSLSGAHSSSQGTIILPRPGSTTLYYVFYVDDASLPTGSGLMYSIVDMSLNGGLGGITALNVNLAATSSYEKLCFTRHANGTDYWIVVRQYGTNNFHSYQLSATGVNPTAVTSASGPVILGSAPTHTQGCMKISQDGRMLATADMRDNNVSVFAFNRTTGAVGPVLATLTDGNWPYGLEFSPDNNLLYVSWLFSFNVKQYNMNAGSPALILSTAITVGNAAMSGMQLGPDCRIYGPDFTTKTSISVINNPDLPGVACTYTPLSIPLGGAQAMEGMTYSLLPANVCGPLPVEWVSWTGRAVGGWNVLEWETAASDGVQFYEVQKSSDGADWEVVGTVPAGEIGVGGRGSYRFRDPATFPLTWYRLRVLDSDGGVSYSTTLSVSAAVDGEEDLALWPNPARDVTTLVVPQELVGKMAEVAISDLRGRVVYSEVVALEAAHRLDVSALPAGVYWVGYVVGGRKGVRRLVKW